MNRHEGVSCDSCLKNNFRGRRYKCLICIDYDLCAACYESGATTNQHTTEHPMQCILSRSDFDLYYGGEALALEQPQAYTCPFCNRMGFTDTTLIEHVTAEHADTTLAVVCPVCASIPGGEPNFVTDDFAGHLTLEHRTGPRDLISFHDEPSGIRHGGVRRIPHTGRGLGRGRRANMQFSTGGGISSLSPSSRDAVVDPIAELLSQLSGVRRGPGQPGTPSQLQQLQMQLQLERQQATAARQQLERLPRRPAAASSSGGAAAAPPPAPQPTQQAPPPQDNTESQLLLSGFLDDTSAPAGAEAESRAALLRGLVLASLGRPPPVRAPPPAPRAPPQPAPQPLADAPPAAAQPLPRAKPQPRTKETAARAHAAARQLPEGR
ncbi:E3 ubiquitin-protein ligase Kcmf1 isoform X2 [Pectinophora gossypiella]|uniref:E3 ubiquitin-protein ligase Kcmf1 isoform X2 n=1 Tax=Pectinophora gossypiella TaxID=13191 RepID=UPI00214DFA17|nr:E3 ubiquitin-protein ligase Kcmf1 isoform X2 [Pectinophora gossypiella]